MKLRNTTLVIINAYNKTSSTPGGESGGRRGYNLLYTNSHSSAVEGI
jgi:hypothetical protein